MVKYTDGLMSPGGMPTPGCPNTRTRMLRILPAVACAVAAWVIAAAAGNQASLLAAARVLQRIAELPLEDRRQVHARLALQCLTVHLRMWMKQHRVRVRHRGRTVEDVDVGFIRVGF